MKSKFLSLAALVAVGHALSPSTASAQTTVKEIPASQEAVATGTTNVATVDLNAADANKIKPAIKYLGYLHGPGSDFSGAHQAGINGEKQMNYEQRIKLLPVASKYFEAGVEARINTNFANGSTINASAGNWRLTSNFKNVLRDDVFNLSLMPRIYLPTSNAARNSKTTPSPDFIAELGIAPKNSRFSFDLGLEWIQLYHTEGATGTDYTNADTSIFAPWAEVDYTLTEKTQLMLSYWPTFSAQAHRNAMMTSAFGQDGGNEIDAGAYYEFVKGWQLNPFVAMELSDIGYHAPVSRNLQLNLLVVGQIL